MKSIALTLTILLCGCAALSGARRTTVTGPEQRDVPLGIRPDGEAPRSRLLILPFLDDRGEQAKPAFARDLARSGRFVLVAPEELNLDPKKYLANGEYDLPALAKLAQNAGVAAVLEGKVLDVTVRRLGDSLGIFREVKARVTAQVRLRVYAGRTGKELFNDLRTAETEVTATLVGGNAIGADLAAEPELAKAAIARAFKVATPDLVRGLEKLNWEGRVAMISGERVFINAGRLTGLQLGDILKVTDPGEEIFDPETGRFIGAAPGRLKGTIEVVSYFGKDGAIAVIHSGAGFGENDHVELY